MPISPNDANASAAATAAAVQRIPVLNVPLPRVLEEIHQIELTSRCNLRCVYCPSPAIMRGERPQRPALDMTRATFERALEWVAYYVRRGTQGELNLAGIGESTLHPELAAFVREARTVLGPERKIVFATNGVAMTDELAQALAPSKPDVYVSLHRPERAAVAAEILRRAGILTGMTLDPAINANTWAGQVDWIDQGQRFPCPWLRQGWAFVYADGRIGTCCLDASGKGAQGHVSDPIGTVRTRPYELCRSCYQVIGIQGYDQYAPAPSVAASV